VHDRRGLSGLESIDAMWLTRLKELRAIVLALVMAALGGMASTACTQVRPGHASAEPLALIPEPARVERHQGTFALRQHAPFAVASRNPQAAGIARLFVDRLNASRGSHLDEQPLDDTGHLRGGILFALDPDDLSSPSGEGYVLRIDGDFIRISARDPRGLFYGSVTLWQLLTQQTGKVDSIAVPQLVITDRPRFAWRGVMLDSARQFQSPQFIKRFIDELSLAKINTFHWHLTDDQGWRIEINHHPRLTEVGAWRRPAGAAGTDARGQSVRYGGYYSQAEIRDIVQYAAARYVTIVPEIDMPGHMQAAIAAYPQLGSAGDTPVVSADWGVHAYLLNPDDATIAFMDDVLDEVLALFPGTFIHVGGDEAVKDQWKASAHVQARMRELGLANEDALQGWFIGRLQSHLAVHGRRLIGWDEILEGDVPADAAVMSWRGAKGGIEAAGKGHDVVMAPSPDLYLDHLQGSGADEPSGRPDLRTLADIYAFEPVPATMDAASAKHVLGAQANLWTEHMRTTAMVEHAAFPRVAALADVLWSPAATHDWHGFVVRLAAQMDRYASRGVAAASTAFEVRIVTNYNPASKDVTAGLSNQVDESIRYTVDGSEPDARSPRYRKPVHATVGSILRAATFVDDRRVGPTSTHSLALADVLQHASNALKPCRGTLRLRLEDDAPGKDARAFFDVDLFDPCWILERAPMDDIVGVSATVGQLPFNFQLGKDVINIVPRPLVRSPEGELQVKLDSCEGTMLARLPLAKAAGNAGLTVLDASIPAQAGLHDLCFVFATKGNDPLWAVDTIRLVPATR
jgi:hexosaminidase